MFTADLAPDLAEDDLDPAIAHAEERRVMLRELAELGMALARDLTRRALEAPETAERATETATPAPRPAPRHDPAESFARLSRAIRLTLALEAKVDEEVAALRAGEARPPEGRPSHDDHRSMGVGVGQASRDFASPHRNRIRDAVFDVINREITDIRPAQEVLDCLHERLSEGERYDDYIHRPLREAVEAICQDLGLHPDWSLWAGDGWTPPPQGKHRYQWQMFWGPRRGVVPRSP